MSQLGVACLPAAGESAASSCRTLPTLCDGRRLGCDAPLQLRAPQLQCRAQGAAASLRQTCAAISCSAALVAFAGSRWKRQHRHSLGRHLRGGPLLALSLEGVPPVAGFLAVAAFGVVVVAVAATLSGSVKSEDAKKASPDDVEKALREEALAQLPPDLEEALRDFDGDLRGPWLALGLDIEVVAELSLEDIRTAYRRAVLEEHPDRSSAPDAEERLQRVRNAWVQLQDEGLRALLLEALEGDIGSLEEFSESLPPDDDGTTLRAALIAGLVLGAGGAFFARGSMPLPRRFSSTAAAPLPGGAVAGAGGGGSTEAIEAAARARLSEAARRSATAAAAAGGPMAAG
mmetsp:Transcript_152523/g.489147  ORF Transcript_152523/g.489147 Transcript_152523/m.489147 type:complete len:345 (+) Transcript_152523:51-1085(+)